MKRNHLFAALVGVILFAFPSCDPGVDYNRIFQNDSQYDLELRIYKKDSTRCEYVFFDTAFFVKRQLVKIIAGYGGSGSNLRFQDCKSCADSIALKVVGNPALNSTVNVNDPALWNFKVLKKSFKNGGTCECRFIMTDDKIK